MKENDLIKKINKIIPEAKAVPMKEFYDVEITLEELADYLFADLELPDLERKSLKKTNLDVLRPCDPLSPMRPMPKIQLGWAPPTVTGKGPTTTASSRQRVVHAPRLKWYPSTTCTRPPFLPSKTTDVQCRAVDRHIHTGHPHSARTRASQQVASGDDHGDS